MCSHGLDQVSVNGFCTGTVVNKCFASHTVSHKAQLCCFDMKVVKDNTEMNECGCIAIKFYLLTKEGCRLDLVCRLQFANPWSGHFSF